MFKTHVKSSPFLLSVKRFVPVRGKDLSEINWRLALDLRQLGADSVL